LKLNLIILTKFLFYLIKINININKLGNNEIQQPTNIFDSLSNQNNTNVSFFDNQNNNSNNTGANWFEQFSQNNEPLVLSNEVIFIFINILL